MRGCHGIRADCGRTRRFKGASEDTAAPAADGPRVLVFGIDGGTWDVARELFDAGELPTLRALYDGGVHGVLESRPPAISPVVWSTIFTGRPHSEHGVESWKTSHSTHRLSLIHI